jgi:3-oxoacyl-[acyl-carrier-protein] synthase-3
MQLFDLNLACSGYIYGLQLVMSMLHNSSSSTALLITGDTSVRTISPFDRSMIMLFGDSGSATLLRKTAKENSVFISTRTDGKRFKSIITPSGAYRNMDAQNERQEWGDGIIRSDMNTHMKRDDVLAFRFRCSKIY